MPRWVEAEAVATSEHVKWATDQGWGGVLFFTAAENVASNQKARFENGGNTHHHLNQPANYQNPGEPTSTTALMNKRNDCLCAFSGYTMWIPPWCIKKKTQLKKARGKMTWK